MEEYRVLSLGEFIEIRDHEITIIDHLRDKHNYIHDDHGDVLFNENNELVIDVHNIPVAKTLYINTRNMFSEYINGRGISDLVHIDVINGYNDVFEIDRQMISLRDEDSDYNIQILGYFIDNVYQGCVWFFRHNVYKRYVGLYAIRSSVVNTLLGTKGVARKILSYFTKGNVKDVDTIVVPWPLHPMNILLRKIGFKRHNISYSIEPSTDIQRFLYNIAPTSEFYTFSI